MSEHPGNLLRNSRTKHGVSLVEAAKLLGVPHTELAEAEMGVSSWEDSGALWVRWQRLGGLDLMYENIVPEMFVRSNMDGTGWVTEKDGKT